MAEKTPHLAGRFMPSWCQCCDISRFNQPRPTPLFNCSLEKRNLIIRQDKHVFWGSVARDVVFGARGVGWMEPPGSQGVD